MRKAFIFFNVNENKYILREYIFKILHKKYIA